MLGCSKLSLYAHYSRILTRALSLDCWFHAKQICKLWFSGQSDMGLSCSAVCQRDHLVSGGILRVWGRHPGHHCSRSAHHLLDGPSQPGSPCPHGCILLPHPGPRDGQLSCSYHDLIQRPLARCSAAETIVRYPLLSNKQRGFRVTAAFQALRTGVAIKDDEILCAWHLHRCDNEAWAWPCSSISCLQVYSACQELPHTRLQTQQVLG